MELIILNNNMLTTARMAVCQCDHTAVLGFGLLCVALVIDVSIISSYA